MSNKDTTGRKTDKLYKMRDSKVLINKCSNNDNLNGKQYLNLQFLFKMKLVGEVWNRAHINLQNLDKEPVILDY